MLAQVQRAFVCAPAHLAPTEFPAPAVAEQLQKVQLLHERRHSDGTVAHTEVRQTKRYDCPLGLSSRNCSVPAAAAAPDT